MRVGGRTERSSWAALLDGRSRRVSGDLQDKVLLPNSLGAFKVFLGCFSFCTAPCLSGVLLSSETSCFSFLLLLFARF